MSTKNKNSLSKPDDDAVSIYTQPEGDAESIAGIDSNIDELESQLEGLMLDEEFRGDTATKVLPEYACSYCGIHDATSVVKCLSTGKWFCNGRVNSTAACVINHLVLAKLREIQLHRESPLGDIVLECYATGFKNVFNLGFVPLKNENTVVLLTREVAMRETPAPAIKDLDIDLSLWQPLIEDRQFVPWLVKPPSESDCRRARHLTPAQMRRIEERWKSDPNATLEDLDRAEGTDVNVETVALRYEDGYHYQNVFAPLLRLEAEYDKSIKEAQKRENVSVRWEVALNKRHVAYFQFPRNDVDMRLVPGDELKLCLSGTRRWEGTGAVMCITDREEVKLEIKSSVYAEIAGGGGGGGGGTGGGGGNEGLLPSLVASKLSSSSATSLPSLDREKSDRGLAASKITPSTTSITYRTAPVPVDISSGYVVEYIWKSITFDRMQQALKTFAVDDTSVSGYLYHRLLGHEVETPAFSAWRGGEALSDHHHLVAPKLPPLNYSQQAAVRAALQQPLSLIQGPPGTGKTVTSASIVYHMAKMGMGQVLVTAPSNVAVDHLAEKIHATGLRVVRVAAKSRETLDSSVETLTLHYQVNHITLPGKMGEDFRKYKLLKEAQGELNDRDEKRFNALRRMIENEILQHADVICCTCSGAGDPRMSSLKFRQVLLDEATQACEPEALIPLVRGAKQVVLVGDHCQLGPVIMNKRASAAGLHQSLFERLIFMGIKPFRLTVQYRMHPCLSEFPSNTFYEGTLQNGVTAGERTTLREEFPWMVPDRPMIFHVNLGMEEISSSGTSYLNRTEASNVEKIVTLLLRNGVKGSQIGVITPYEGQRAHVELVMERNGPLSQRLYSEVEVASVDAFQGREKDYIILSCVRSNEHQGIGFLSDPRRLNVALTRAKYGLMILGNPRVLARHPLWNGLLVHFRDQGCLCEGLVTNLKRSVMQFVRPKKSFRFGAEEIELQRLAVVGAVVPLNTPDGVVLTTTEGGHTNAPPSMQDPFLIETN